MPEERRKRRHRRGEGSVFLDRTAGVWVAQFSLGIRDGKRIRRKRTAPDEQAAKRELARLQRWYGDTGDVGLMTLDAYLADWLDVVKPTIAPRSWEAYRGHVRYHIAPLLGGIVVAALRPADIRRLIRDRIAAGKSAQTVISIVSTLRTALSVAVRDGELSRNVAAGVDLPRVDRLPVEAMTPERAQAILDAVDKDPLRSLYVLLLGTGLRVGEAVALDWGDIDLASGRLTVQRGKSRAARRSLPLPRFVVTALTAHKAAAVRTGLREPVWVGERRHERLTRSVAARQFTRLLTAAGLPKMTLHQLRHGTATLLLQRGVPMRDISDILGHASPALTARLYTHVSEASKRRAMATLDEMGGTG